VSAQHIYQRASGMAWRGMDDKTSGFVYDQEVWIFIHDAQKEGGLAVREIGERRSQSWSRRAFRGVGDAHAHRQNEARPGGQATDGDAALHNRRLGARAREAWHDSGECPIKALPGQVVGNLNARRRSGIVISGAGTGHLVRYRLVSMRRRTR